MRGLGILWASILEKLNCYDLRDAPVFKAHDMKKRLVAYDQDKALELLGNSEAFAWLTPLYRSKGDVTDVPRGLVATNRLNLKPKNVEEARCATQHDE